MISSLAGTLWISLIYFGYDRLLSVVDNCEFRNTCLPDLAGFWRGRRPSKWDSRPWLLWSRGWHQINTTRKKPICDVQNLVIGGVSLYATGKTPLVQAYPWRTNNTPRLTHPPVAYRPVRHGYDTSVRHGCILYPWRTGLYASGVYHSSGVHPCTPLMCSPLNFHFCTPRLCFFEKKNIVILLVYCRWDITVYIADI
jgi:hypothetical protein